MSRAPCLAAAQTVPIVGDIDGNLDQHLQLAQVAATEGATLLVFPELSLTGYELALGPALAFAPDDARLLPLLCAAREYDLTLVAGAPVRTSVGLHIAAFIVEPSGRVRLYTKQHLGAFRPEDNPDGAVPPPEDAFFVPGLHRSPVAWGDHTVALSICADSLHPPHAQAAAEQGASIYLSCQFAISAHMAFKQSLLKAAARQHGFAVVFSNYGGPTGGLRAGGGSCVRAADGSAVARLPAEVCGLALAWEEDARWTGRSVRISATCTSAEQSVSSR